MTLLNSMAKTNIAKTSITMAMTASISLFGLMGCNDNDEGDWVKKLHESVNDDSVNNGQTNNGSTDTDSDGTDLTNNDSNSNDSNSNDTVNNQIKVNTLSYIGESVIPDATQFDSTTVGGLSSIDYANGKYYMISDDAKAPIRFYEAELDYTDTAFNKVTITKVTKITDADGNPLADNTVDPEALRYEASDNTFVWTNEGQAKNGINPSIQKINMDGKEVASLALPANFVVGDETKGVRHNGSLESLSHSINGDAYWFGMEHPLIEDGETSKLTATDAPVRISYMNKVAGKVSKQFVYKLDDIARDSNPSGGFMTNGVVELLAINDTELLVLERSYAVGHTDGGNNVKIYKINTANATNVVDIASLKDATYTPVTKELLFDFESVRSQLTGGVVDNIEGMTFGQDLPNGNKSLVLVADNNFSAFGPQLNQFVVLEVSE